MRFVGAACALLVGLLWAPGSTLAATEVKKSLLLLPVAGGTAGLEWSAKALGGIIEEGFSTMGSVRLVLGTARETALRELSVDAKVTPAAFREICRRAGADFVALGGSTLVDGRIALEMKTFDVGAGLELKTFRGEEPVTRTFNLVEAAIRHIAATAALGVVESPFPRGVTTSLEAYAAYRAALLEQAPAARIEKLRGVLRFDPAYADPTRRLGVELFRQGATEEALVVLEHAVALGPKVAEARNNYGVALAATGRPEQAQREFEEAVSLAPEYAEARLNLARVLEDRGRSTDAEKQYASVLEADAGNDKARAGIAALYDRTGRQDLAIKEFRLLSARNPDLAEAEFIRFGQEARKAREYARAEKFFLRATDINPQFAKAWAELGTNSYLAGEYPKGIEYFRKALTIDPGQAAFHYYLGLALEKGRQQEEALREYRRAVELGGPPEARLGLARAALESGDPGLAVEELNRLLVASPDHAEAKLLLAQATIEMEARRRLVESQSQFANQRLARLEQIVADTGRVNRELEARVQALTQERLQLEKQASRPPIAAVPPPPPPVAEEQLPPVPATPATPAAAAELGLEAQRLHGALEAEREARKKEALEKERFERELTAERERYRRDLKRLQSDIAAAQAKTPRSAPKKGEAEELRTRIAQIQAAQLRAQSDLAQQQEERRQEVGRLQAELESERAARRAEAGKPREDPDAAQFKTQERERLQLQQDLAAEKSLLAAAKAALEKAGQELVAERETHRADIEKAAGALAAEGGQRQGELEKLRGELEAANDRALDRDKLTQDLAAAQAARQKLERELSVLRSSGEQALADERASRRDEAEKLRVELGFATGRAQDRDRQAQELSAERAAGVKLREELAAEKVKSQEKERLAQELAAEKARLAAAQLTLEGLGKELAGERERCRAEVDRSTAALAAERVKAHDEAEKLKADLTVSVGRAQDRERLAQELAKEREESRRQTAQGALRLGALETQVKLMGDSLRARESDLDAAHGREAALVAQLTKSQSDLALFSERASTLEARLAAETRTRGERDTALAKAQLAIRDLALELGRIALRTQSWEEARGYLEQVTVVDPRSAEAWYGLGEAFFQLGQYEKSKQMYDKTKQIH